MPNRLRQSGCAASCALLFLALAPTAHSATVVSGPWNASVLEGGVGMSESLPEDAAVLKADADWTMCAWVRPDFVSDAPQLIAGFGKAQANARFFYADHGRLGFWWGQQSATLSGFRVQANHWQHLCAVSQGGKFTLFAQGLQVTSANAVQQAMAPELTLAPQQQPWSDARHFGGKIADFTIDLGATADAELAEQAKQPPSDTLTRYQSASPDWPVQGEKMAGMRAPQPPSTLPHSNAAFAAPVVKPLGARPALQPTVADTWSLGDWYLASATDLPNADGAKLSQPGLPSGNTWRAATVPGTVLTTLVDRGVYPDPAYGLDNMDIPESLNQHDWWYRTTFRAPAALKGKRLLLTFKGINYAGEIWVNGRRVGHTEGAFVRGMFDVTDVLRPGQPNTIAVRVSPPPHPGIPHEQSILAGAGPNGGMEALDGPTFIATEGWDWIPAIRDRDTGLWQGVTLHATGAVKIGDPHVITHLDGGDLSQASIDVDVPLDNPGAAAVHGTLKIHFGDVDVSKAVSVAPGGDTVRLRPSDFPQLVLHHPQLWWPNGYGDPYLYTLHISFTANGAVSDQRDLKFGIRQISYELSLFDAKGQLRRVLVDPEKSSPAGTRVVDVTHRGIRKTPNGWAYSLLPAGEHSSAVSDLTDTRLTPYLVMRVNGVRIAIKGGSWGTDDYRKRISRARLEPYFKLQRDAHMNVIRNWVGQNTEPVFYQLADEYGMLVFNDFWQSTQDYNLEPQDDALFLRNAEDVIRRYRNHPSVALWFGRNEGVPQPLLNKRLDAAVAKLDGTRLYMPSSNNINLWFSGPYNYRDPVGYFTDLAQGFAVEVGTPSFPTLEAFKAMVPKADRWPISDAWAYHDWHQAGNGDTATFMQAMDTEYGKPTGLEDFVRKAQMMNYVTYRALFEGMNAHLWTKNSGRMLWMTHPAWPSTSWQIYSHDYDTQASYYGVMHASQPVHVQMNLPDRDIAVINNTRQPIKHAQVLVKVYGLDGAELAHATTSIDAPAGTVTPINTSIDLNALVLKHEVAFVTLALSEGDGTVLSRNFYWTAEKHAMLQRLNTMARVPLRVTALRTDALSLMLKLDNTSAHVALNTKLTLLDAHGKRILPAYYSDNYVSLAPGESHSITVQVQQAASLTGARIAVRGWNVDDQLVSVDATKVATTAASRRETAPRGETRPARQETEGLATR